MRKMHKMLTVDTFILSFYKTLLPRAELLINNRSYIYYMWHTHWSTNVCHESVHEENR